MSALRLLAGTLRQAGFKIFKRTSLDDGSPLTLNDGRFDFFHTFLPVGQVLPQRIASGLGQRAADRRPAGQRHLAHREVLRQRREGRLSPHALSAAAREQPAGLQPDGHAGRPLHGGEHARAPTDRRRRFIYLCFFFFAVSTVNVLEYGRGLGQQ